MGRRASTVKATGRRNRGSQRAVGPWPCARRPGRPRNPPVPAPDTLEAFLTSLRHVIPELPAALEKVPDPRVRREACTYTLRQILMLALIMLCCQCPSRRRLDRKVATEQFEANYRILLGDDAAAVTCADNMDRVLQQVDPQELEKLAAGCTKALNRRKVLRKLRSYGLLVVAVDGTEICSATKPCAEGWLTRSLSDGSTQYYRSVLAAKVVTAIGLILPVAFEFIENTDPTACKQDCETKAFRRLAPRIGRLFARTRLLLVGDGLYAQQPVMEICERHGWGYMASLGDGQLPSLQEQIARARQNRPVLDGQGRLRIKPTCATARAQDCDLGIERTASWITPLRYHGRIVHIVELTETRRNGTYHNVWVTDLKPNRDNAMELAQTGRLRWKIENEGFNTLKNGGYEMGHVYGARGNAWKNYFLLLQISQLLNNLYRLGDLPAKLTGSLRSTFATLYGSMQNFAECLMEAFRTSRLRPDSMPDPAAIQIRFPDVPRSFLLCS